MQGSKFKHQRHFPSSNGRSGSKVGEQSVVGSPNTKTDGQAVLSPLITPASTNEHGDNGTTHGMNKGKQDQETKDTKQTKKIKFIIKPSKEGVTILCRMQQVTINVAKVLSQQLKGKIESVDDEIIDLIGPANETEVIINGMKVNALLDTGSQITSISESYYKNNLSNYPLIPVDIPNLKVEQAGGSFIPYIRMVILDIKVPHLTPTFKAKVIVVPDTDYHFTTPALVGTGIICNSRDQCKKQYGNQYLQKCELPSAWVCDYQYVNASDKSLRSAKSIKSMTIQPGQTIHLPVITRTSTIYEPTDMMVEMTHNIKGVNYSPIFVTLKSNTTLERFTVPITNVSQNPITIQADKILFNLELLTDITTVTDIQCQMTNCASDNGKTIETEDNIKKLTAMTKLEAEQKEEFANLLKQYPNLFAHNNDSGHTTVVKQDTIKR